MSSRASVFHRIWLPGFLLQSVIIGGGYATGRELIEYFLSVGPIAGLLGMLVATIAFSVISVLGFELARVSKSYNYRSFFVQLLGKGWFIFEFAYFVLGLLVFSVIGAAAGELVSEHLGLEKLYGTLALMILIGFLVLWGTSFIEKALAGWSFLLYLTYAVFVACYLWRYGGDLSSNLSNYQMTDKSGGWLIKGVQYVGYNIVAVPIILFCVKHMTSRRDTVAAGLLAGPLAMIPAFLFFLAMSATYPDILQSAVPADFMIQRLELSWLKIVFYVVVFGTFVETGAAYIHAVNERINQVYFDNNRHMPRWLRPMVAFIALFSSVVLAEYVGLVDLISKGYGTLTWIFIAVFIIPLLTVGVYKISSERKSIDSQPSNYDLNDKVVVDHRKEEMTND